MTAPLNVSAIERSLMTMRTSLDQLESIGPVDVARLTGDCAVGVVVERVLALLAELACVINRRISATVLGEVPVTSAGSFASAARAGAIEGRLALTLAPPEGPHHVLVQLVLDAEPEAVAPVVSEALSGYRAYAHQVADWVANGPKLDR
ncbi:hypothetical protein ACFRAO_30160 [Streptomyces sp. NPDC056656]|uniref:hypothetical protein n=1 Tax=Streptomyces sp. NPDC056656 TaxID=3345895 RepID=UPI0036923033